MDAKTLIDRTFPTQTRAVARRSLEPIAFALLLLLGFILAFERTGPLIRTNYIVLTNVETIALLAIVTWLAALAVAGRAPRFPKAIMLPGAAWLAILIGSTLAAPAHQDKALLFLGRVLAGISICLVTYNLTRRDGRHIFLFTALASGACLVAFFGLAEGFGWTPAVVWLDGFKEAPTRVGDVLRVSATLSYATITAMVLEMILPLLIVLLLIAQRRAWQIVLAAGILVILSTHVLTLSRAGIISLLAALMLMALAGWWRGQRQLIFVSLLTAALLLVLLALVLGLNPMVRLRLTTETEQSWYQARYVAPDTIRARPGEVLTVPIAVTNSGERIWSAGGEHFFALAYHLYDEYGESVTFDGERTPLPSAVAPGESITLAGWIRAPQEPGNYRVEWDMVQEAVNWFSWEDAPTASSRLVVVAGQAQNAQELPSSRPPTDVRVTNPTPGRFDLWQAALQMALDHPLLGVGPDNFRWRYGDYAGLQAWDTGIHANNLYLEMLADTGMIGLLAFLWFSWRLAREGMWRLRNDQTDRSWLLGLGLVAGLATWYIHGFFDYFYEFTPTYMAFWLLVGLLTAVPARR